MARATPVPDWVPTDLPTSPGVYAFRDPVGNPLYVGKSVNLRRRVRGYFYGGGPDNPRLAEMLRIARDVSTHPTGSDLEARLEEADRIIRERPPYNKALKRRGAGYYLELRWSEPFPRLRVVRRPRRSGARYVGPFWGRRTPERVKRLIEKIVRLRDCAEPVRPDATATPCIQHDMGLCTAPCARRTTLDAYRRQAEAAVRLLTDGAYSWDLYGEIERSRDRASEGLDFERAAIFQTRLDWLEELEQFRFVLEDDGGERSWLIALPGTDEGTRILQPVALGRVLARRTVACDDLWPGAVEDACYAIRVAELRAPTVLSPTESVPSLMIRRWLEDGSPEGVAVDLTRYGVEEAIARLSESFN
ncbi:MAG: hypothetical protein R3195_18685 [Gemmatimonadota bacterium]|nr:hypothetical protein [Gemmatimonadota bacterium]